MQCLGALALVSRRRTAVRAAEWVPGAQDDHEFLSFEAFKEDLEGKGELPQGFRLASSSLSFVPEEAEEMGKLPMRLTVICLDEPTDRVAAVFTQNAFPGAPVKLGKRRLIEKQRIQAVVVNNKISNVSPPDADGGVSASETICAELAKNLGLESADQVLPSSTGVIGWRLPVKEMVSALPKKDDLKRANAATAAEGIMTHRSLCQGELSRCLQGAPCGDRKGRWDDRAEHGHHAVLPDDRCRFASRRSSKDAVGGG